MSLFRTLKMLNVRFPHFLLSAFINGRGTYFNKNFKIIA